MRLRSLQQVACLSIAVLACVQSAQPARAGGRNCLPVVRDAWVRMPPVSMPMLAGFARFENDCGEAVVIVGARSTTFGRVELHESTVVDGISRMRAVPRLRVGAHATRQMEPGGLHLMLMQPKAMPAVGDSLGVEFELSDGRRVQGRFEVRVAGAR